ncbi:hypothetical protein [Schaalia hyovaginalis]|uniref:LPXTG cell wall anchor domain-containing protein n=1 Tax=Schaalia hyovaginalis TaxID=29316 RepID=A0A923IXV6_9ACTO|nr:hypothetical protein [Schaalia hyovaginalis]MBB6334535.1 hypothetical protein [Schaalia hyovaginalis]MDY2668624.1 hypothetical protein [Schaalia hyovaginalis]
MRTRAMTAFSATMLGGLLLLAPIGAASAEGAADANPDPSIERPAPSPLSLILADADGADPSPVLKIKVGETRRIVLTLRNDGTSDLKKLNVTDVSASPTVKLVEQTCRPHDEILSPTSEFVLGVDQSVTCSFTVEGVSKGEGLLKMTAFGIGDAGGTGDHVGLLMDVVEDAPVPPVVPDKPVNPDKPVEPENPAQPDKPGDSGKPADKPGDSGKPADKPSGPQAPASTTTPASSTTAPAASKRSEVKLANTGAALIGILPLAAALGIGGVMLGRRKRS